MLIQQTVAVKDQTSMTHCIFVVSYEVYKELLPMISHMYIGSVSKDRIAIVHPVCREKISRDKKPQEIRTLALALWELELSWIRPTRYCHVVVAE